MAGTGPTIKVTFAGDADALAAAAKRAEKATLGVGDAALEASKDMNNAADEAGGMESRLSNLGNMADGASTAIGDAAGTLQAFADISDAARAKQARLERALNDVAQAQADYNQAVIDGKQATTDANQAIIDERQARLDAKAAELDYAAAVEEFGAQSIEAEQALIDRDQAQQDLNQAVLDGEQALADGTQATIDAKGAQLDLNDAQSEANPTALQEWADNLNLFAPLLQGLVGVLALVTAGQWLWNAAQAASPMTWIIVGIVALVAVIVLIATQTTWFQDIWNAAWSGIKSAASAVWEWLRQVPGWIGGAFAAVGEWVSRPFRDAFAWAQRAAADGWAYIQSIPGRIAGTFASVAGAISRPFRSAFNFVSDAWNNSIGRLSWTVPGWIPFIGGNTISAPRLPKFHTGGVVPGAMGQEVLAVLQAGERVIPTNRAGNGGGGGTVTFAGNTDAAFAAAFMHLVRTGKIQIQGA